MADPVLIQQLPDEALGVSDDDQFALAVGSTALKRLKFSTLRTALSSMVDTLLNQFIARAENAAAAAAEDAAEAAAGSASAAATSATNAANAASAAESAAANLYPPAGVPVSSGSGWNASKTAPTGEIVGTTDTQTLTNKIIRQGINTQAGTSYTITAADAGKLVMLSDAAVTVEIPPNTGVPWAIGDNVDFAQLGTGQVTFAPGAGVTLRSTPGLKLRARYSGASAIKVAADEWLIVGDLSA